MKSLKRSATDKESPQPILEEAKSDNNSSQEDESGSNNSEEGSDS